MLIKNRFCNLKTNISEFAFQLLAQISFSTLDYPGDQILSFSLDAFRFSREIKCYHVSGKYINPAQKQILPITKDEKRASIFRFFQGTMRAEI